MMLKFKNFDFLRDCQILILEIRHRIPAAKILTRLEIDETFSPHSHMWMGTT